MDDIPNGYPSGETATPVNAAPPSCCLRRPGKRLRTAVLRTAVLAVACAGAVHAQTAPAPDSDAVPNLDQDVAATVASEAPAAEANWLEAGRLALATKDYAAAFEWLRRAAEEG